MPREIPKAYEPQLIEQRWAKKWAEENLFRADVNAPAQFDGEGVGGQTALFHAASQFFDFGLPVVQLLVQKGADLGVRAKLPGHYERPDEVVECTALGYARMFPGNENATVEFLRSAGAPL